MSPWTDLTLGGASYGIRVSRPDLHPRSARSVGRQLGGILHVLHSGCRRKDYPPEYGPAITIYDCYNRWSAQDVWHKLFARLAAAGKVPRDRAHVLPNEGLATYRHTLRQTGQEPPFRHYARRNRLFVAHLIKSIAQASNPADFHLAPSS